VLIIVAGLMRVRGRRRAEDEQLAAFDEPEPVRASASVVAARARARVEELSDDDDVEADEPSLQHEEHELPPHHEGAQTSDVIGEADIYIAYGRYPQAVSLLLSALDDDPNRSDVRVKLLEVYAETKDEAGFETHMNELLARCDDNELLLEARELETKLREDGPVASVSTAADDDPVSGNLDDFQLDLDAEEEEEAAPTVRASAFSERASDDLGGDLGIDFKPDDEPTVMRPQVPSARVKQDLGDVAVASDEGDDFDLEDLEFEPVARTEAKPRAGNAGEESDDAFEFLNEEDAATTKLDLARAYIDMGDEDGAREILTEVLQEGSSEQQQTANELLAKLA
jgi:pilus assembly protein FimV